MKVEIHNSKTMITRKTIFRIFLLSAGIYALLGGILTGIYFNLSKRVPCPRTMKEYTAPLASNLYDENGEIIHRFYEERRIPVELRDIPELFQKATIAVEDRRFYSHWGVDPAAILRALIMNLFTGRVQGASTITQQLARNMFLSFERTYTRKLKEAILTIELEREHSKDEILELYLNEIYYGAGSYGIETASRRFFDKRAEELTLTESALLIGLPRAPSRYNPIRFPQTALRRRATILEIMKREGVADRIEIERAKNAPLGVNSEVRAPRIGPYLVEEVRKHIGERLGSEVFYRRGVSIYTTVNRDMQEIADQVVREGLLKLEERFNIKSDSLNPLQIALFAMDPHTGEVKALVGGRDFGQSQFNRAIQAYRQPGSAFKPFLYTAAVNRGYPPSFRLLDQPVMIEVGDTVYSPSNYDGTFLGEISLRDGLALSRNLASVRLIMEITPETVVRYTRLMGVEAELLPVISLALGTSCVTLKELVTGFATIANGGFRVAPYIVKKVVDGDGNLLYTTKPYKERVLSEETAYVMTSILSSVTEYGTGAGLRRMGFIRPSAGKTGTTDEWRDAWFIGFTPELICGVWIGYDIPERIMRGGSGAVLALPIWAEFMKRALEDKPVSSFTMPSAVIKKSICKESGLLPVDGCKEIIEEIFIKGTEPEERCDIHSGRFDFRRLDAEGRRKRL